jgi:tRNA nucleotidyltransferase/poly(A) polymerase
MPNIDIDINSNLTSTERKVFNLIDNVRKKRSPSTVVRAVGGWTRDKLLNKPSDDIDLMVDNISGAEFAKLVAEELGITKDPHIIQENPEKTKNIEAAKMHIPIDGQEIEIDFVQARTEEYGSNRREVSTRPASAQEDAMRRDLTIGAIFYNINEKKVEDFTGKGLKDLITNTIRTPYDSGDEKSLDNVKKTFIEDPLRVFRAIRFAAKYNGNISPATLQAMQDPDVINAIFFSERKIATERIGQEFKKMLKSENPQLAIKLLKETGLLQHIINSSLKGTEYEGKMEELDMDQKNPNHELNLWGHTYQVIENLLNNVQFDNDEKRIIMILAALTHDFGKLYRDIHGESSSSPVSKSYHGHEKASKMITEHILRFLKFENNVIQQVSGLANYHMAPHQFERGEGGESAIRRFIRKMGEESLNWIDVLNLSIADAYSKGLKINPKTIESYNQLKNKMEHALTTMKIENNKVKPILNGNQIMDILGVKPGRHISVIQEYFNNLRDEIPDLTEEQAKQKLLDFKLEAEQLINSNSEINNISEAIMQIIKRNIKVSNKISHLITSNVCSKHLFENEYNDINNLFKENKYTEALSKIKSLFNQYPEDDNIARFASIFVFKILCRNPKSRDNELLQLIMDRASNNLFDPILHAHSTGLLILLKTSTDFKNIKEIGEKVCEMNSGIMRSILDQLPKEIYHKDLKDYFENMINKRNENLT